MRRAMLLMVAMAASAIAMLPAAAQPPDTAAGSRVRIDMSSRPIPRTAPFMAVAIAACLGFSRLPLPLKPPDTLTVSIAACNGRVNAWYSDR